MRKARKCYSRRWAVPRSKESRNPISRSRVQVGTLHTEPQIHLHKAFRTQTSKDALLPGGGWVTGTTVWELRLWWSCEEKPPGQGTGKAAGGKIVALGRAGEVLPVCAGKRCEVVLWSRMSGLDLRTSHRGMCWKDLTHEKMLCKRIKAKRYRLKWRRQVCISTKYTKEVNFETMRYDQRV